MSGISRTVAISAFNESIVKKVNTAQSSSTGFLCTHDKDYAYPKYFNEALKLCFDHEVHTKLGLSLLDLLSLDTWTFSQLRKKLETLKPIENKTIDNLVNELKHQK